MINCAAMTPFQSYQQQLLNRAIQPDPEQERVILLLQQIYEQLIVFHKKHQTWLQRLLGLFVKPAGVPGIYLFGEVGAGKTFLIDTFFNCLPLPKLRMHFHEFMCMVHAKLKMLKGKKDPLAVLADEIAKQNTVLCLDEFIVMDIADAMILTGLLRELFIRKVCFVTTSNIHPDQLYSKGLQRQRFLPAISLIKKNMQIVELSTKFDYRYSGEIKHQYYWYPSDHNAKAKIKNFFLELNNDEYCTKDNLIINQRAISVKMRANGLVWLDFLTICGIPRSQHDFLELASNFHTVFISDVPVILPQQRDLIRTFINLIDVLYDNHVRLVISAEVPIERVYPKGPLAVEFERTRSRIAEMQTISWWGPNNC